MLDAFARGSRAISLCREREFRSRATALISHLNSIVEDGTARRVGAVSGQLLSVKANEFAATRVARRMAGGKYGLNALIIIY